MAFENPDGSVVTVLHNSGGAANYVLAVAGQKLGFAMPENGWATVNYVP